MYINFVYVFLYRYCCFSDYYRDTSRKDPRELQSTTMDLFNKCQKERVDDLDQANQELDRLRKHADKLQAELQGKVIITLIVNISVINQEV